MADAEFVTQEYDRGRRSKENMPNFYKELDVYVCMSQTEGLNNGIMEAGAMGLPIVSTRCGAAEEMIKHCESGLIIDRDAERLSEALIILRSGFIRQRMGEKMKEEIRSNWTWDKRIEDFRKLFEAIVELLFAVIWAGWVLAGLLALGKAVRPWE